MRLIYVFVIVCVTFGSTEVWAESSCGSTVWKAAQVLQPWFYKGPGPSELASRSKQLRALTDGICAASAETSIDPLLALAIAMRESSLRPQVGLGKVNGKRGERGYFQILPGGSAERFRPEKCSQHEPGCNAMTALRFMSYLRSTCKNGSDPWVWIGAYGDNHCPSPEEARGWDVTKVARRYYCKIEPACSETWPE